MLRPRILGLAGLLVATVAGVSAIGAMLTPPVPKAALAAKPPTRPRAAPRTAPHPAVPAPPPADVGYVVKAVLDTGGPIPYGKWFWDERGAPSSGQTVITVDLAAGVISVFRDGFEIGTAAMIDGYEDKPTPLGVFPITQKDADHRSNLYGGAPMPYMLRLTNDGISIHGSEVSIDRATHGCIGVPTAFAKKLFAVAKLGDKVIVTRGEMVSPGQKITAA
ncbi:L,D-transpeptidase family protein [Sphingomonas aracearum]|uniref:L,D-transpeptidase n=1 Tax=Sphingomonas aracearum TaxID=2283317 RepID=A0A369VWW6_9SPHN|nr:L,D-transpeptidase family protein [Sphingomonas aracearum]RDE06339.1 L,D-transpeptidase [Sphingomonas aracearum]